MRSILNKRFWYLTAILGFLLNPSEVRGQLPDLFPVPDLLPLDYPWIGINYPKLFWTEKSGVAFGARLSMIRQLSSENYLSPSPYEASLIVDGQLTTSGSRQLLLELNAPAWADGWRFRAALRGSRQTRENYFGVATAELEESQPDEFYESQFNRLRARGTVQRRIIGHLRLLGGVQVERWKVEPITTDSRLQQDLQAATVAGIDDPTTDFSWRLGLVFDTRNDEISSDRGVLVETIFSVADSGFAGDAHYTRTTVAASGYLPVSDSWVLAARVLGQGMGGSPTVGSLYLIESSRGPFDGLGGNGSHRALPENRLLGKHKLLGNFEARYHALNVPRTVRATVVGFVDAGRVFQDESFEITLDGLEVGGGLGLFLQLARAGILGSTFAVGSEGLQASFHSSWPF